MPIFKKVIVSRQVTFSGEILLLRESDNSTIARNIGLSEFPIKYCDDEGSCFDACFQFIQNYNFAMNTIWQRSACPNILF
jgi:hypothetical protein